MPSGVDEADEPWAKQIKRMDGDPFFPTIGASLAGEFIYYATENK